jgi:hypothetical protein
MNDEARNWEGPYILWGFTAGGDTGSATNGFPEGDTQQNLREHDEGALESGTPTTFKRALVINGQETNRTAA